MPRPRKKVSKQKAALKQQQKKKPQDTQEAPVHHDEGSSSNSQGTPVSKDAQLEELRRRQKIRRRRILWDNYDEEADEMENGEGEDDYDSDEDTDGADDHDDDTESIGDCETSCRNPDCKNYCVEACPDYQVAPNAVLVRAITVGVPQLTLYKLQQGIYDIEGNVYGGVDIQRADNKDFLLSFDRFRDIERIIKDGMIIVEGYMYPAIVLPIGTSGDFFRDYNTKAVNYSRMNPLFKTWMGDISMGLYSEFARNGEKYVNIAMSLDKGYKIMDRLEE